MNEAPKESASKYSTYYNTRGQRLTSTPAQTGANRAGQTKTGGQSIPSGKGGQTPWNSTRSARDWLDSGSSSEDTAKKSPSGSQGQAKREPRKTREPRPSRKLRLKKPNLPSLTQGLKGLKSSNGPGGPGGSSVSNREKPARPPQTTRKSAKTKQPKVITATISGLIFAAIVLLAECGLWGFYCYSHTLPGDTNVKASTFMYCLAVFVGNFWAGAVVRRRTLKPSMIICGVFLALSLVVSLNLFSWREIKIKMFLLKILFTIAAAALGFILSLIPYLINKYLKQQRQAQEQRRQRQLEHRQLQRQQRELEKELAKRTRGQF